MDRAVEIRAIIETERLSPRLQSLIKQFDEVSPLAHTGLGLLAAAPELLGADRPRTFLILIQNEDELRATGGFIRAVGRVTIDQGKIISLTVEDSYALDDFKTPYPDAPAPIRDYMGIDLWVFRDSNWSPDFPATARQALALYTKTRPGTIDGVIGVNQHVVEALVEGAGPITVDGHTLNNAADLQAYMRAAWEPSGQSNVGEWAAQRKDFMSRAIQVLLDRIMKGQSEVDWQKLGRALHRTLRSRDLLFYFTDPTVKEDLQAVGFAGALRTSDGDFLMVVDSSMGFNKTSIAMQQALAYTVTLDLDRAPQAQLTIVYTNTIPPDGPCVHRPPDYNLEITYDQLVQQCYWLYRRVLAPPGSELQAASHHPTGPGELLTGQLSDGATQTTNEDGKTAFGTLLIVPRGEQMTSFLSYTLPITVLQQRANEWVYHLIWQKQPGAGAWPATVTVQWPAGLHLLNARPQALSVTDRSATFEFVLDMDQEVSVTLSSQ
jgi:hypothetical protein